MLMRHKKENCWKSVSLFMLPQPLAGFSRHEFDKSFEAAA